MNAIMNLRATKNAENFLTSLGTVSFSTWTLLHSVCALIGWLVGQSVS